MVEEEGIVIIFMFVTEAKLNMVVAMGVELVKEFMYVVIRGVTLVMLFLMSQSFLFFFSSVFNVYFPRHYFINVGANSMLYYVYHKGWSYGCFLYNGLP